MLDYQKEGKDQERFYSWLIIKEKGSKGLPIGCESCYLDKDSKVKIIYQKEKIDIKVAIFYLNSLIALLIVNSPAVKNPDWYVNEVQDDASISWRKRKKHFFILSHSGKPIYSRFHFWLYYGWSFFVHQLKKNINLSQLFYQIWRRTQACWVFCNITSHHFFCWKWVRLLSYQPNMFNNSTPVFSCFIVVWRYRGYWVYLFMNIFSAETVSNWSEQENIRWFNCCLFMDRPLFLMLNFPSHHILDSARTPLSHLGWCCHTFCLRRNM